VVGIPGIYETELVREISFNNDVRINETEACEWNCLNLLPIKGFSYYDICWWSPTFRLVILIFRDGDVIKKRDNDVNLHICKVLNHFTIVDQYVM
jgi:hypothetical protein